MFHVGHSVVSQWNGLAKTHHRTSFHAVPACKVAGEKCFARPRFVECNHVSLGNKVLGLACVCFSAKTVLVVRPGKIRFGQ